MGAGPAAEEPPAFEAAARLAAQDRFAVPDVRQGSASADPLRRAVDGDARQRARRRNQGAHPRARRQGHHREDLPAARHVHRHARDQPGVPAADREPVSRTRLPGGHRHAPQSRHVVHPARPRIGAHHRSDEPLQHDVRPVLHGRQSGRLRPRADVRRGQEAARRRDFDQAAAADDGAVLGRRADDFADLPRVGRLRAQGRLLQRAGRDQRHPLRAGAGLRDEGARRRAAHRVPAVRRHRRGGERAPQGRATCST